MCLLFLLRNIEERNGPGQSAGSLGLIVGRHMHMTGLVTAGAKDEPLVRVFDLLQKDTVPYQRRKGVRLAEAAAQWAWDHRNPFVGIATEQNVQPGGCYGAHPLLMLFATVSYATDESTNATHFWQQKLAEVASYFSNTKLSFALADKAAMALEVDQFGFSSLDPTKMSEVGVGILDDVPRQASRPPLFAVDQLQWSEATHSWVAPPHSEGGGAPTIPPVALRRYRYSFDVRAPPTLGSHPSVTRQVSAAS
jgi:hypothetical protein|eukprot:COSAG01_NODE_2756_length_7129_cov_15.029730_10_plen_251_part_00